MCGWRPDRAYFLAQASREVVARETCSRRAGSPRMTPGEQRRTYVLFSSRGESMTKLRHGLSLAVVCLTVGSSVAQAQDLIGEDDAAKPATVDDYAVLSLEELLKVEVSTSSVKRHSFEDAPATVYVVPASVIRRRGYTHLRALLEDIPEFEMPVKNSAEHSSLITVRGVTG